MTIVTNVLLTNCTVFAAVDCAGRRELHIVNFTVRHVLHQNSGSKRHSRFNNDSTECASY